jgi:glycosyltransferase involved in cell wall biosynthesis
MKKVGIVTTWFERGAAYVSKQFKEVWEEDCEIFIYARGGEDVAKNNPHWHSNNLTYGKRFNYTRLDLIDLKHFENWIKENKLDIVFFNEQHMWSPVLLCNNLGIMIGSYIDYYTPETIELFGLYDFLICNTKRHFSVFKWHPQVYYIPWGTNTTIFNERQKKITNLTEIVFFHSAGMNPYRKGTDYVIRAFSKLNKENTKLVIHTQTEIIKIFPDLKKMMNTLIQVDKLEIINNSVPAPGLYHLGDVYVYPTRLEGIGLTIAEANACGMPVITTNEAPMNEFIKEGINGHLVNIDSKKVRKDGYYWEESYIEINHLIEILNDYASNISELDERKKMALAYAQKYLSWDKNSKKLSEILPKIKKIDDKSKYVKKVITYEKTRSLMFYVANTVLYQKMKQRFKRVFS